MSMPLAFLTHSYSQSASHSARFFIFPLRDDVLTKSGAMVGLGETTEEVQQLLRDLRRADVEVARVRPLPSRY